MYNLIAVARKNTLGFIQLLHSSYCLSDPDVRKDQAAVFSGINYRQKGSGTFKLLSVNVACKTNYDYLSDLKNS